MIERSSFNNVLQWNDNCFWYYQVRAHGVQEDYDMIMKEKQDLNMEIVVYKGLLEAEERRLAR